MLDNTRVKKWSDLADAFLKQYKFNIDIAPDQTSLMIIEKNNKETVREYARRWGRTRCYM
jgi:putative SOS response-associated peptidase YedK